MKQAILIAGAALLAFTGPAYAQGHGNQGNHGKAGQHGPQTGNVVGYGVNGCPPGLAKKPHCMPPGQYKKLFEVGQRVPTGYRGLMGYNSLPVGTRDYYGPRLDPYGRYIYDDNYLYRVDPTTMLVSEILRAVL